MIELCRDQGGCRFLQKEIEADPEEATTLITEEIIPEMASLMMGVYSPCLRAFL